MNATTHYRKQAGVSMIELMVSIVIGLIIMLAISTLFVGQLQTSRDLEKSNSMIDNGRYAMDMLTEELKLSGFYGALELDNFNGPKVALPSAADMDICENADVDRLERMLPIHVQGVDAATVSSSAASASCLTSSELKAGSDVLVIRRADTNTPVSRDSLSDTNPLPYLQISGCQSDMPVFAVAYNVDKLKTNLTLKPRNCSGYATVRPFLVHLYYVDANNEPSDGIPTLKRKEWDANGNWTTVPLVEGIEYMQIDYGLDHDADPDPTKELYDGVADEYTTCAACSIKDWSNIVSVKINLIARTLESQTAYTDKKTYSLGGAGDYTPYDAAAATQSAAVHYKRHLYTQVVRLVNPSSRREQP